MSKWLKWGIGTALIYTLTALIIAIVLDNPGDMGNPADWLLFLSGVPIIVLWGFLFKVLKMNYVTLQDIGYIPLIIMIVPQYFALGSVIGGIIQKIRK